MAGVNHTRMQGKYLFFQPEFKKFKRSFHIKGIRLEEIFFSRNVRKAWFYDMVGHTKFEKHYVGGNFEESPNS